jgi:hypothetical protein
LIERSAFTVHEGVPDVRCELPGAFAELKLPAFGPYVPGLTAANAAEADKASRNIDNAATIPTRLIFIPFLLLLDPDAPGAFQPHLLNRSCASGKRLDFQFEPLRDLLAPAARRTFAPLRWLQRHERTHKRT